MRTRTVFVTGLDRPLPRVDGARVEVLQLHRLAEAGHPRPGGTVVVAGVRALTGPYPVPLPAPLLGMALRPYTIVLLWINPDDGIDLDALKRLGIEVHWCRSDIEARLADAILEPNRIEVRTTSWAPQGFRTDPLVLDAIFSLPRVHPLNVDALVARLQVSRHTLARHFRAATGTTPSAACEAFVRWYRDAEMGRGIPAGHIAASLGYANASNILAVGRHGKPRSVPV